MGLIPMSVGGTAEKLVRGFFAGGMGRGEGGGGGLIQNFRKGEIYLIWENFVRKKFSLGKIFVT